MISDVLADKEAWQDYLGRKHLRIGVVSLGVCQSPKSAKVQEYSSIHPTLRGKACAK